MGKHRGDDRWRLPLQPKPTASRNDYLLLIGAVMAVASCCGIGSFLVKVLAL